MGQRLAAFQTLALLGCDRAPQLVDERGRLAGEVIRRSSRCSDQSRSRVSRAIRGSQVTTFISVSLKNECSLRLAEPIVSQASSTMPILAWT